MDTLDLIETFAAVARKGSFSAAALSLGQPPATVSRKVSALEDRLGVQLLIRTTRVVRLTEGGIQYLERMMPLCVAMEEAEDSIKQASGSLSGELTITSPIPFGVKHLVPLVSQFLNRYPEISIHHVFDNCHIDYVGSGIDLGLRIGRFPDSGMRQINLGTVRAVTCASAKYIEQFGTPNTPEDLSKHRTVAFGPFGDRAKWNFCSEDRGDFAVEINPVYRVDSIDAIVEFVRNGGGIGYFYSYQVADLVASKELKILLPSYEVEERSVSFLYPDASYLPKRTRVFLDFASARLRTLLAELATKVDIPNHP